MLRGARWVGTAASMAELIRKCHFYFIFLSKGTYPWNVRQVKSEEICSKLTGILIISRNPTEKNNLGLNILLFYPWVWRVVQSTNYKFKLAISNLKVITARQ